MHRKLQSECVNALTIKLEHTVVRLLSEQTAEQRALWIDTDRAIVVTQLNSPFLDREAMSPVRETYESEYLCTPIGTVRDPLCSIHVFF